MRLKLGKFRAEKVKYRDGVGCCIWVVIKDEDSGLCFDFAEEDIDTMIALLENLKKIEPEIYNEDDDDDDDEPREILDLRKLNEGVDVFEKEENE